MHLIVTLAFGSYAVGDRITDPAEVEEVRNGSNHNRVVAVAAPEPTKKSAAE